ncbi:MAG: hypothetical protein LAT53_12275 [Idiomarina sp.]|nr:hypothetical protein [Idiomarina sp.]
MFVPKNIRKRGYFFRSGDWDTNFNPLVNVMRTDHRYQFYQQHIFENVRLDDTDAFRYHMRRLEQGRPRRGFETEELIRIGLQRHVKLFRDIERAGKLLPGSEVDGQRRNEIGCVLGRDGRLMKLANGNNRFAIALLLEIDTIPIQIDFVHVNYIPTILDYPGKIPCRKINNFLDDILSPQI